jgi:hypothetical protein
MHWIDPDGDINYGVQHHFDHRFWKDDSVKFNFFIFNDVSKIIEAKARIRSLFDLKNFSIHINETHDETIWIAEQILSKNGIHFMNHAQPWLCKKFLKTLRDFTQYIEEEGYSKDKFCLVGDSVLAVYGLKDSNNIEFLSLIENLGLKVDSRFTPCNEEIFEANFSKADLINDPRNHFYFRGIKFLFPFLFTEIQPELNISGFEKDKRLIDSMAGESINFFRIWRNLRFFSKVALIKITNFNFGRIKKIIPKSLRPLAKKIYQYLFHPNFEE